MNSQFFKHASPGNRVVPWSRTDRTTLIVACQNFANTLIKPLKQQIMNASYIAPSIRSKLGIQQYFNICEDANMSSRSTDGTGLTPFVIGNCPLV